MSTAPVRLLLLADTHVPTRARALPAQVWQAVEAADVVFHAGDWQVTEVLDELQARAHRLVGVWGNNDGAELRRRLPEIARVEIGGVRFAMTHETGAARGREQRMATAFVEDDVLIFGHSHIPWDSVAGDETANPGLRLLNPGSPTDRRRQPECTLMTAAVQDGRLADVRLVAVDRTP
ncbi:metallophosphoesterase [Citricoccus sp. K5]|uniref:metallophosphoesterase family protein n=1 Tax=Citricoccus sp. K5 TaxID=2653135 RepID=UPI0012F3BE96|nr:metallophosphoesterase [Citricoccus sp. K5]VXB92606.1 Phosphoesterase [Citricoccus sp. K5]